MLGTMAGLFYSSSTTTSLSFSQFTVDSVRVPYTYGVAQTTNTVYIPSQIPADPSFAIDPSAFPWLSTVQAVNTYDETESRWDGYMDSYALNDPVQVSYSPAADGAVTMTIDS